MRAWTSESLREIYVRLLQNEVEFVVIGGQAINLWSDHYSRLSDLPAFEWESLEPFSSGDLDCLGSSMDALAAGKVFGVEVELYSPFSRTPVPNSGSMVVPINEGNLLIHFLHTPYGASADEVRRTARLIHLSDTMAAPVMHPLLCLETKITNLFAFDQRARQDLKHVRLACLILHEYIRERVQQKAAKDVLNTAERVGRLVCTQLGLTLWRQYGIACESFIPLEGIREASRTEGKLDAFLGIRWPIIETKIRDRRMRFEAIASSSDENRGEKI